MHTPTIIKESPNSYFHFSVGDSCGPSNVVFMYVVLWYVIILYTENFLISSPVVLSAICVY